MDSAGNYNTQYSQNGYIWGGSQWILDPRTAWSRGEAVEGTQPGYITGTNVPQGGGTRQGYAIHPRARDYVIWRSNPDPENPGGHDLVIQFQPHQIRGTNANGTTGTSITLRVSNARGTDQEAWVDSNWEDAGWLYDDNQGIIQLDVGAAIDVHFEPDSEMVESVGTVIATAMRGFWADQNRPGL